ncbi:MAG TPA: hypothetical protein VMT69_02805 [Kineosporiaceae bacterium]|nr:hypothetical protein [Kineosporiaceae bacterium]
MIPGSRGGPARLLCAAAAALAVGGLLALHAVPAAAAIQPQPTPTPGTWSPAWSWRAGAGAGLPPGCTPLTGSGGTGDRWSAGLVNVTTKGVLLAAGPLPRGAAGSGLACLGHALRYGRMTVHARLPRAEGLVSRMAFWPSGSRGSDWSGVSVPSSAASPAFAVNGCGGRVYGATIPGHLTGRFRTWTVTWTPEAVGVAVDGQQVFRGRPAYPGRRWPRITLGLTGNALPKTAALLIDAITVEAYASAGTAATAARSTPAQTDATPGPMLPAAVVDSGPVALMSSLDSARLGTPWLVGGALAAVGCLAGVVRAAILARRRPAAGR